MGNPWFRFYESALDDPKVQLLPPDLFKFWVNCLCLTCRNNGVLPPLQSVSFSFRLPLQVVESNVSKLKDTGLLDERRGTFYPHNWNKRQYKSDVSTDRVKRFRKRADAVSGNVSETPSDTDTEQIQNRTDTEREIHTFAYGEHKHAVMTAAEFDKLKTKLNSFTEEYIQRFDSWVQQAPDAKHQGVRRKDRDAYASICQWYAKDLKEGKIHATHSGSETPGTSSGRTSRGDPKYIPRQ